MGIGREGIKMTIETSFGKLTASESALNSLALNLFMTAQAARGVDSIYAERCLKAAITIRNELEISKFCNIKEE